jgi:hypothetical protein
MIRALHLLKFPTAPQPFAIVPAFAPPPKFYYNIIQFIFKNANTFNLNACIFHANTFFHFESINDVTGMAFEA